MAGRIPNVFVIVFVLILAAAAATWLLPGGRYERRAVPVGEATRQVVVPGSYATIEAAPQGLALFAAPLRGFVKLAEIIAFIFVVGGAFAMINESGAIASGIGRLVRLLRGREIVIVPLVMLVFSFFGAAFGMCEEAMPFALIFVPLALALGYDSLVGVSMSFVAAGVGFAAAFLNPFTLQIAQNIAAVEPLSGLGYRLVVWAVATALAIGWVTAYALRVRRDPRASPMYDLDQPRRAALASGQAAPFTPRHGLILALVGAAAVLMVVGVLAWDWYIAELAGLFLALGIAAGLAAGQGPSRLAQGFVAGCKEVVSAALIVGFAGGILVLLEDGRVLDTILHGLASATAGLPPLGAAYVQYAIQLVVNFFIPSGSTKAALTMPLMAPLADLSGITRQTAVLAYQLGDGFTNLIIPTSGVTIGTLGLAKIPYERWLRWHWPLQLAFVLLALAALVWPVMSAWE